MQVEIHLYAELHHSVIVELCWLLLDSFQFENLWVLEFRQLLHINKIILRLKFSHGDFVRIS